MLLESFVAVMALIAAASLQPGVYFAVNSPAGIVGTTPAPATATITRLGIPGDRRRNANAGAGRRRKDAVLPHRRRALARAWAWRRSSFRSGRRSGAAGLLVSLRHHVRGAVHPDDARRRHSRRALHAAGPARTRLAEMRAETNWMPGMLGTSAVIVAAWGYFLYQGVRRSAGRHQFAVAAVRDRQSAAGGDRAVRRHHHPGQDARREVHVGDLRSAGMAGDRMFHRRMAEDFLADFRRSDSWLRPISWPPDRRPRPPPR